MIYFDNAATTWPKPAAVADSIYQSIKEQCANPGRGGHRMALDCARRVFETRSRLARLFGVKNPGRIVFTLNTTDAINMAMFGLLRKGDHVVTTCLEHNAVARVLRQLELSGVTLSVVECDKDGVVHVADIEAAINDNTRLIIVNHVSNVVGSIQPIYQIGEVAARRGVELMIDAAQSAGLVDIDVEKAGVAILCFAGHKGLYGPQGTGGVYVRDDLELKPWRYGGTGSMSESDMQPDFWPDAMESGTPNTPGIVGLGAGVEFVTQITPASLLQHERKLAAKLVSGLLEIEGVTVYGSHDIKMRTGVVAFNIWSMDSGAVAHCLDQKFSIALRGGLHCAPWPHQFFGTLKQGMVRASMGWFNNQDEVEQLLEAVNSISKHSK